LSKWLRKEDEGSHDRLRIGGDLGRVGALAMGEGDEKVNHETSGSASQVSFLTGVDSERGGM